MSGDSRKRGVGKGLEKQKMGRKQRPTSERLGSLRGAFQPLSREQMGEGGVEQTDQEH